MSKTPSVGLLVAGAKGLGLLASYAGLRSVRFVFSYHSSLSQGPFRDRIEQTCSHAGVPYEDWTKESVAELVKADLVFTAGWQYFLREPPPNLVVLHDALLPRYRGYSPTVNALLRGEERIGVTAFRPVEEMDKGPVYAQVAREVRYPITIAEAYGMLAKDYAEAAARVVALAARGELSGVPQDESLATYCLWRDEHDYWIDWGLTAAEVRRAVDALGWPYAGARTTYGERPIVVERAEELEDLAFEGRQPGKIWEIRKGCPTVVCGKGLLRIIAARDEGGLPVRFEALRERLGARGLRP